MEYGEHSVIAASVLMMLELSAVMLDTLKVSRINPSVNSSVHHDNYSFSVASSLYIPCLVIKKYRASNKFQMTYALSTFEIVQHLTFGIIHVCPIVLILLLIKAHQVYTASSVL